MLLQVIVFMVIPLGTYGVEESIPFYFFAGIISGWLIIFFMVSGVEGHKKIAVSIRGNAVYYLLVILLIVHLALSLKFDLYYRRIGTENLVKKMSETPYYFLVLIRYIEIVFPVLMFGCFISKNSNKIILSSLFLIFVFSSSAWSSRATIIMYIFAIFYYSKSISLKRHIFLLVSILAVFLLLTVLRYGEDFSLSSEFVYMANRLDTYRIPFELISKGFDFFEISLDLDAYKYYMAQVPFIDESKYLRSQGYTNAKVYFLKDVLNTSLLDAPYNFTIDLIWVFGFISVLILIFHFFVISYISTRTTRFFIIYILPVAFFSLTRVEYELFGSYIRFFRDFILFLPFYLLIRRGFVLEKNNLL